MPSPSPASTLSRVARYRRDCANLTEPGVGGPRFDRAGLEAWCAGRPWRETELRRLATESGKLDEVFAYLAERIDETETVKQWRDRRAAVNHVETR